MARGWWSGSAQRGDAARLEAFSDGVLAIAITLLILEVRVEPEEGESLAHALGHAMPQIVAYAASFLQIGIMWVNHHALFRTVRQVDQIMLLANLLLLGFVSFLPLPTRLVAEHTAGADGRVAMLLYGGTLTACALMFNAIWWRAERASLLRDEIDKAFRRDVGIRYVVGFFGYLVATLLCLIVPWVTLLASALLALVFVLGPSPKPATTVA